MKTTYNPVPANVLVAYNSVPSYPIRSCPYGATVR